MNLEALVRDQNLHWFEPEYHFPEADWPKRRLYPEFTKSLETDLIVLLTGLRRVGKSTLIKQVLSRLLEREPSQNIFYFSFDQSVVKNEPESLRRILETYASLSLHQPLNKVQQKTFIFLDEVQIIPYWQDVIKTHADLNPRLKFVISGSSSLLISRQSAESLAGRFCEISLPPLSFEEYLKLNREAVTATDKLGLEKYGAVFPEYLTGFFERYLTFGQFPQPVKNHYTEAQTREYLRTVEDKIIEFDLPRTFPIKRPDILHLIFNYLKETSGNLLSYENLTNDLGVDIRTTIRYLDWLKKTYLLDSCLNQTKKLVKSARTAKKFYLTAANFGQNLTSGQKVETYIFNFLKSFNLPVEFFRFQNREIDFIITNKKGQKIPLEVKYRENLRPNDEKELVNFARRFDSPLAFLITKSSQSRKKINGFYLYHLPAAKIESSFPIITA